MSIDKPIIIALTLFVILLMVIFLVMPEYKTFGKLQAELGEKSAEVRAQNEYYAAIARTYFDLQSRLEDIKKIDNALPKESAIGKVIYYLQKVAGESGLVIKGLFLSKSSSSDFNNAQTNSESSVNEVIFSMDLLGDYPSLGGFISALEESSRIFEITNITFGTESGAPYNFSLQIKTYSY